MAKPIEVAGVCLNLPDGRVVLQRRDDKVKINPGGLGFFGGHVEEKDLDGALLLGDPDLRFRFAICREIGEETNLVLPRLCLTAMGVYDISAKVSGRDDITYGLFYGMVDSPDFEVREGVGAEAYTVGEALSRSDISGSARFLMELGIEGRLQPGRAASDGIM